MPTTNPQHRPKTTEASAAAHRLFRRVRTPDSTAFWILGIPVLRRDKSPMEETVRFLGIPVKRTRFLGFERKIYLFGIPVAVRTNLPYLEQFILRSLNRLNAIAVPPTAPGGEADAARATERERLLALPSYRLMCRARDGELRLEDELKIVTAQITAHLDEA
jgi:hypothetical protein